jgi:hypothetical protein
VATSPKGFGPEKEYAGEDQQHIQKIDPDLSSERAPLKNKTVTVKE